MNNFLKSLWNNRHLNSKERYLRQERLAKLQVAVSGFLMLLVFFGLIWWSV